MANGLSLKVMDGEISLPCRVTSLCCPMKGKVAQSSLTLCEPVDCSLPGSSVHGILQARILEWVVVFFSRDSSQPRDRNQKADVNILCLCQTRKLRQTC